jgi:hypothetical protein
MWVKLNGTELANFTADTVAEVADQASAASNGSAKVLGHTGLSLDDPSRKVKGSIRDEVSNYQTTLTAPMGFLPLVTLEPTAIVGPHQRLRSIAGADPQVELAQQSEHGALGVACTIRQTRYGRAEGQLSEPADLLGSGNGLVLLRRWLRRGQGSDDLDR